MPDPDIEKRKKRKRSARFYLSNAHPLPSPEQLAALADQFPSNEDDLSSDGVMLSAAACGVTRYPLPSTPRSTRRR